jgi:hypothetical protein
MAGTGLLHIAVQRNVVLRIAANHQLSQLAVGAAYSGVAFQNAQGLDDFADARFERLRFMPMQTFEDSVEVFSDFRGQLDASHVR